MNKIPQTQLKILEFLSFLKKQKIGNKINYETFKTYGVLGGLPIAQNNFKVYLNYMNCLRLITINPLNKTITINQEDITKFINFVRQNYELNQHTLLLLSDIEASE